MGSRFRRGTGVAVLSSLVGTICLAAPAHAALPSPVSHAYVVQADALGATVAVPPTPLSVFPPGGTVTQVGINLGPFLSNATLTATTAGNPAAGTSSASATVDSLTANLAGLATIGLTGVNSTCDATTGGATGSGTIASGTVTLLGLPAITLQAAAAPNTTVSVPGVGTITLNERTTDVNGVISVNALHLVLLPALGAGNVVVGHVDCGGSAPVAAGTPVIGKSAVETSFVAGQTVHYVYNVTNTGTTPLTGITVVDHGPGAPTVSCPMATLAPGANENCTAAYVATAADAAAGHITDFATISGTLGGATVTGTSNTVTLPVRLTTTGRLTVRKSVREREFRRAGDRIHYTFTVTNNGTVTLQNVSVTDLVPGVTVRACGSRVLAPGGSTTCRADYVATRADVVAGRIRDRGTASAVDPGGSRVTAISNEVVSRLVRVAVPPHRPPVHRPPFHHKHPVHHRPNHHRPNHHRQNHRRPVHHGPIHRRSAILPAEQHQDRP
jgi:uncharacterized repeat protein (TIGR01451 family)